MREEFVTCDICGKLLAPTHDAMPWSPAMQFDSVKITYIHNGKDANYDICPRCLKRMKRYLAREAKKDGGPPMIDKTLRKATAERHGPVVVVRYTGGGDCLWLNMYLDCEQGQMVCDSDIGFYAYHWGRSWYGEDFISFCIRWLSNDEWLFRRCIDENHEELAFDRHETVLNLRKAYDDIHNSGDEYDVDCSFDEVLDIANGYDNKEQFIAALSVAADERGVELPDEWWSCIVEDYTPRQKRFAEICLEVIVPELKRMIEGGSDDENAG